MATNFNTDEAFTNVVTKCSDNIKRFVNGLNLGKDPSGKISDFPINWHFLDLLGCCQKDGGGKYFRVLDFYNSAIGQTQHGGWRSYDEQQLLYEIGRNISVKKNIGASINIPKCFKGAWTAINGVTKKAGGYVVTNCAGGASYHNYGLACDIILRHFGDSLSSDRIVTVDGVRYDSFKKIYEKAGILKWAKECNLTWGGSWSGFPDYAHFQDDSCKPIPYLVVGSRNIQNKSNCSYACARAYWNGDYKMDIDKLAKDVAAGRFIPFDTEYSDQQKYETWTEGRSDVVKVEVNLDGIASLDSNVKKVVKWGKWIIPAVVVGFLSVLFLTGGERK